MKTSIDRARHFLDNADALLIGAGAGMGVDSGLPDFRGNEGFWNAYPPYRRLGFDFMEMANPARFADDPALGWGFYGHRLNLYRATKPHAGFSKLLACSRGLPLGYFVFTSNVDGQFQTAGFEESRIVECHGSIHHFQCLRGCSPEIWEAPDREVPVDLETMRAIRPLPACPRCEALARPAILMFGDWSWNPRRTEAQEARFEHWLRSLEGRRLVILEFGAGNAVPTVRRQSESLLAALPDSTLIRVNPRESRIPGTPQDSIALEMGALEACERLGL